MLHGPPGLQINYCSLQTPVLTINSNCVQLPASSSEPRFARIICIILCPVFVVQGQVLEDQLLYYQIYIFVLFLLWYVHILIDIWSFSYIWCFKKWYNEFFLWAHSAMRSAFIFVPCSVKLWWHFEWCLSEMWPDWSTWDKPTYLRWSPLLSCKITWWKSVYRNVLIEINSWLQVSWTACRSFCPDFFALGRLLHTRRSTRVRMFNSVELSA